MDHCLPRDILAGWDVSDRGYPVSAELLHQEEVREGGVRCGQTTDCPYTDQGDGGGERRAGEILGQAGGVCCGQTTDQGSGDVTVHMLTMLTMLNNAFHQGSVSTPPLMTVTCTFPSFVCECRACVLWYCESEFLSQGNGNSNSPDNIPYIV